MTSPLKRLAAVPLAVVLAGIDVPELAASDMIGEVLRVGKPFLEKELTCLKVESDKLANERVTVQAYSVRIFQACQEERIVEEYRDALIRRD